MKIIKINVINAIRFVFILICFVRFVFVNIQVSVYSFVVHCLSSCPLFTSLLCVHRFGSSDNLIGILNKLSFVMIYLLCLYLFVYYYIHHDFHMITVSYIINCVPLLHQELLTRPELPSGAHFRFLVFLNSLFSVQYFVYHCLIHIVMVNI